MELRTSWENLESETNRSYERKKSLDYFQEKTNDNLCDVLLQDVRFGRV